MSAVDPSASEYALPTRPPSQESDEDFSQVMREQLQHAPWLVLSVAVHLIAGLLLYMVLDGVRESKVEVSTTVALAEPEQDIEDEKKKEEEVVDEPPVDPDLIEQEPIDPKNDAKEFFSDTDVETDVVSAFDSKHWNTSVGLGGGAAGKFGGRIGRKTDPRGRRRHMERSIRLGLEWLQRHQDEDGKWDCDGFMKHDVNGAECTGGGNPVHDVGVTGLALLAFLGDGSTLRSGPYKDNIKKAVSWLRRQQQPSGLFGTDASHDFVYGHAIATYAMCEAYGLSKYTILKNTVQKAINYLESHRNPYSVWRYQPRDNDNDTSVTGWCIMCYKSARDFGLQVNDQAMKTAAHFLDQVTDPATGKCGYTRRGEESSRHPGDHATRFPVEKGEAMTAVGLFARFFLGQDPKNVEVMRSAADTLMRKPPVWKDDGSVDHYYWYYATYALYQMGGKYWRDWVKKLSPAVVAKQRMDGNAKGSWDPSGVWGEDGGRVYSTATLVLTLEAYYRITRLVR